MPFGVSSGIPNVIIHAKFRVDRLRGFWAAGPPKVPFSILIGATLTTVLHYRADCDMYLHLHWNSTCWCYFLLLLLLSLSVWCIRVCVVLFQATSFNERNAFLVAFQVLRHLLHCNFFCYYLENKFWLIDWVLFVTWRNSWRINVRIVLKFENSRTRTIQKWNERYLGKYPWKCTR